MEGYLQYREGLSHSTVDGVKYSGGLQLTVGFIYNYSLKILARVSDHELDTTDRFCERAMSSYVGMSAENHLVFPSF